MPHPHPEASPVEAESWENEGGSVAPEDLAKTYGIARHIFETYSVGGYRYSKLADAIAQARRMIADHRALDHGARERSTSRSSNQLGTTGSAGARDGPQ